MIGDLSFVRGRIAELVERLADEPEGEAVLAAQVAHEHEVARLEETLEERTVASDRAFRAVASLRGITAPNAMLAAAPEALARGSRLDRVILSVPREGTLVAEAAHVRDDPAESERLLEALQAQPVALEHPLIETEALRRRRATLVSDIQRNPRVDRATAAITGWSGYVVAPVAVRSTVVAVLHADRLAGPALTERDAGILWAFAAALAQAYESASLRRTLRQERRRMRQLLTWLDARSSELADATVSLVPRPQSHVPLPEELEGHERRADRDGSPVLDAVLTRREVEILRLLANGLTNRAIASELVISGGTVKFHVNSILRKLHVANRAEAVAHFYAFQEGARPRGNS
jgi:LuxR family transcriptional regulator, regulator of acetate metabolism